MFWCQTENRWCSVHSCERGGCEFSPAANLRLVSADEVKALICKYVKSSAQKTLIYEIELLNGCPATEKQMLEILGNAEADLED